MGGESESCEQRPALQDGASLHHYNGVQKERRKEMETLMEQLGKMKIPRRKRRMHGGLGSTNITSLRDACEKRAVR